MYSNHKMPLWASSGELTSTLKRDIKNHTTIKKKTGGGAGRQTAAIIFWNTCSNSQNAEIEKPTGVVCHYPTTKTILHNTKENDEYKQAYPKVLFLY